MIPVQGQLTGVWQVFQIENNIQCTLYIMFMVQNVSNTCGQFKSVMPITFIFICTYCFACIYYILSRITSLLNGLI